MHWSRRAVLGTIAAAATTFAGCSDGSTAPAPTGTAPQHPPDRTYGYTHLTPGGNRALGGSGAVASVTPVEIPIEGEPAWLLAFDGDGDGGREVVTTVADSDDGARIRIYRPDGTAVTTGPVYGSGWRHQLCVAPFSPDGQAELAVVRKPHVNRTVEFYRLEGGSLSVAATLDGFASHTYGSRNLDGGLAADLDADGRTELLVPPGPSASGKADREPGSLGRTRSNGCLFASSLSVLIHLGLGDAFRVACSEWSVRN